MRIIATSDLHYNIARSRPGVRQAAQKVAQRGGDVLVIAGDIAGIDTAIFAEALELFADFRGPKLLVAGNHDLWVAPGRCSLEKWSRELPQIARRYGFHMLDHEPYYADGVAFVGTVGWYDYSFRLRKLDVPLRFYQAKMGPGRVAAVPELSNLLESQDDLHDHHFAITAAWRDGQYVNLPFDDPGFTDHLAERLDEHLKAAVARSPHVVAVTHHLPRRELVWYRGDPGWDFVAAFLGSDKLHAVLRRYEPVKLCLSGHSHRADSIKDNGTHYVAIGSTYLDKALVELDL
ncbi:MAG: hypothetical protein GXY33_18890 [Phycisphaerae bacterium]|nr:hypothetical protein [Phycisphaerae bacterium]